MKTITLDVYKSRARVSMKQETFLQTNSTNRKAVKF